MQAILPWCRHHLLPLLVLAFMLGLIVARQLMLQALPVPFLSWFMAALLALILFWLLVMLVLPARLALVFAGVPLFFCLGLLHGWQALQPSSDVHHLSRLLEERSRVSVYGRVLNMVEYDGQTSRCVLDSQALLRHGVDQAGAFQPAFGKLDLRVRGQLPDQVVPGVLVLVLGWAEPPKERPGTHHDPALRAAARGIAATLWLQSADALMMMPEPQPTRLSFWQELRFAPERLRQQSARFLHQHFRPEVAGVYQALLLGTYQGISPERMEQFKASGTLHILAISGLHISLVGALCAGLFYFLLKRSTWVLLHSHAPALALLLTAPILLAYASLAGLNMPVLRALVSALLVLCAVALRRRRVQIHLLAGAALLVLVLHPLALFTASFQLSFSAVSAILLVLPRLPWFALETDTRRSSRIRAFLLSLLLVSVAASIGTLPIMLYHFNRVSLIGPVMNLFIEPLLCLWTLPLGLLALVCLPMLPELALLFLKLGSMGIELTLPLLKAVEKIPFASLWTITPHPLEIVLFYLMLALFLQKWHRRRLWQAAAGVLACTLMVSFTSSLWIKAHNNAGHNSGLRLSFIDVGQGASTLLELPDGRKILLDAGGYQQHGYDVGSRRVAPFLWQRRIWRLDAVLVSHADSDHYIGMPFILRHFAPKLLYTSASSGDAAYQEMLHQASAQGVEQRQVQGRVEMAIGPDFELAAYGLGQEEQSLALSDNDRSLLVRLVYGRRAFLFPADIAVRREELLLRSQANGTSGSLRADLLLAGHHGSIGSTSKAFLEAVSPQLIVVSAGASRRGSHPAEEHLRLWQRNDIAVFNTASSGSIAVQSDGERLCVQAQRKEQCFD